MRARSRALTGLMLSVVGLSAAGILKASEKRAHPAVAPEKPTVSVAVAARDLPIGATITAADVQMARWPADIAPPSAINDVNAVVGRGVLDAVLKGEPLLRSRLAGEGEGAGLPALIEHGSRALSVRVDDVIGIAGFVQPNTYVDVLVTARSGNEARSAVALQGVKVLATGRRLAADTSSSGSGAGEGQSQNNAVVTLLVTPWQAELLTLAATEGHIQLALRNPLDVQSAPTTGAALTQLIPSGPVPKRTETTRVVPRRAQPAATAPFAGVEVYNGPKRAVTTFKDTAH
jgi:pilus assembly protein CpaB